MKKLSLWPREVYKEAERRFKANIPPGYMDTDKDHQDKPPKDQHKPPEYIHGGIIYKRKYGDYLIWRQLLAHAKNSDLDSIIFITDDRKEDWWESVDEKTIGPRQELIEEAKLFASVDSFLMYKPERFLKYAKKFLEAKVSDQTLEEVRGYSGYSYLKSDVELREPSPEMILDALLESLNPGLSRLMLLERLLENPEVVQNKLNALSKELSEIPKKLSLLKRLLESPESVRAILRREFLSGADREQGEFPPGE